MGAWDTALTSDGIHTLSAKAYDNIGNMGRDEISVTVRRDIDLIVTEVTPSATTVPIGGSLTISYTVKNQGTTTQTDSWFTNIIYLSSDAEITWSDRFLGRNDLGPLTAGSNISLSIQVTIPTNTAPNTYYIGVITDYYNRVHETNENNNSRASVAITVN